MGQLGQAQVHQILFTAKLDLCILLFTWVGDWDWKLDKGLIIIFVAAGFVVCVTELVTDIMR